MRLDKLSDLLWQLSPNLFFISILLSFVTGICYSLLIPFVMYAIGSDMSSWNQLEIVNYSFFDSPTSNLAVIFLVSCFLVIFVKSTSLILSTYIANTASVKYRLNLYKRIQNISLSDLESVGQAKIINLLNVDLPDITLAATRLPQIWVSIITILGTLTYLIYLDTTVFLFVLACLFLAIITFQVPIYFATVFITRSRRHYDVVQEGARGLIYGAKELRLSTEKSTQFYEDSLLHPEQETLRYGFKGSSLFIIAENYGEIISFLVIGVVVFHLPYVFTISQFELFGIIMALLYMTGPVGFILNTRRDVKKGQVALERVKEFYAKLSEEDISGAKSVVNDWTQYSVENMEYKYKESNGAFALRNINISFSRGQVSFIIGGNGSGKSTLSKCLSLHYRPTGGRIAFDKQNVERDNLTSARNKISAIYSDYYLFKKLYGISTDICVDKINKYLDYLQLSDKVVITNGCFSTTALSDGQRKRLALLVLLLENRDICIFDEWAADQDPEFKEIFYRKILRELKLENKVIIVISHDDRFFEHADRLITMENGTVKHDSGSINKIESKNNHGMFEFSEKQLGCLHAAMSD